MLPHSRKPFSLHFFAYAFKILTQHIHRQHFVTTKANIGTRKAVYPTRHRVTHSRHEQAAYLWCRNAGSFAGLAGSVLAARLDVR